MKLAGATVLVVDDEPVINLTMSLLLRRAGATVLCAENGAEALRLVTTSTVDLMICDQNMPVMDGNMLLRQLHAGGRSVPTLFFTSGMHQEDDVVLQGMGVVEQLTKPIQPASLIERVTAVLAKVQPR